MFSKPTNKTDGDLDLNKIKNDFLRKADNDNYNFPLIQKPSATSNHHIDYDSKNINFKRDIKWRDSPHLNEI